MADLYREKVTRLARGLEHEESRTAAAEAPRGLIDAIVLTPKEGELKRSQDDDDLDSVRCGARNHHYLQLWRPAA
jgi:hypothetical protein